MTRKYKVTDEQEKVFNKRRRELENRFVRGLIDPEATNKGLQKLIEGEIAKLTVNRKHGNVYPVTIDYGMSFAEMIRAGHYDQINSDINEKNFPVQGSGKVTEDPVLVHLGKTASTQEILDELDRRGFKPASAECLLAFGATYPEKQKEFPIIALGSVWMSRDGRAHSPFLGCWDGWRRLYLLWRRDGWNGHCRFLAVRK